MESFFSLEDDIQKYLKMCQHLNEVVCSNDLLLTFKVITNDKRQISYSDLRGGRMSV